MENARFRPCRRPPWSDTSGSASAGSNSARSSIGWSAGSHGGAPRRPNRPEHTVKEGVTPASSPRTIPELRYSSLSEPALFSAGSRLRSAVQGRNPKPPIPGRTKRSNLRQLAVSRILAQSQNKDDESSAVREQLNRWFTESGAGSCRDAEWLTAPLPDRKRGSLSAILGDSYGILGEFGNI